MKRTQHMQRATMVMIVVFVLGAMSTFAEGSAVKAMDLTGTFDLAGPRTPETPYYLITNVFTTFESDAAQPRVETYRLKLRAEPVDGSNSGEVTYTTDSFTMQIDDQPVVSIPALDGWSYVFRPTASGLDEQGQVLGIAHSQFENLVDSDGTELPAERAYLLYNTYIDFHAFCDLFAVPVAEGQGIQDLTAIGQKIVHADAFSEAPIHVAGYIKEGSMYRNGEVTLEFKGLSVIDGVSCAIVEFDSGKGSFTVLTEPMPEMTIETDGYSHYVGDLYLDLTSRWVRRVVMDEIVFGETRVPMPTGETMTMYSTTERRIMIEAVEQAAFEK